MNLFVFGTRGFPDVQGGVEKHCESLYDLLAQKYNVTVFRRKPYISKALKDSATGIHFIDLPSTQLKGFEALFHSFLCTLYCIAKRPDIVHVHNIGPGIFIPLLKLTGLKVVLTYHSANYEHDKWGKLAKVGLRLGEFLSLKYADFILFVNKEQRFKYKEDVLSKSIYLPNGIEKKQPVATPNFIHQLGLLPNKYILSVGRITHEKGFDYLIDAYTSLSLNEIKLVVVGGSDHDTAYFDTLKSKSVDVLFTGYLQGIQLEELYSFARMFVLPSYNEGYPIVLLEAINYNLPILASNISANLQLNLPPTSYFEVGSVTDLAEKITMILELNTPRSEYELVFKTWSEVADELSEIYQYVIR